MKVVGWAIIGTDGIPTKETDVYKTKRSMLISYDLMPLRGLGKTEKVLQSKGMIPTEVEIVVNNKHYHGFAPVVNGIPDIEMMDYGCFYTTQSERLLEDVAMYLSDDFKGRGVERFHITEEEQLNLKSYSLFDAIKVKGTTRKKALEKLKYEVATIFGRTKIVIETVELKVQKGKK